MFFDLVRKNSKRSRRENGIFFASLLVSIIASYVVLSLEQQDVMIFLRKMESQAVDRLLSLIPVLYGVSLFIIFFLIYYACKYQLERRSHEMGMYLMLGMRRSKLFAMLMIEDLWSSLVSLVIGIPAAVIFSEIISLVTVRLVGLGILGHRFSISVKAVLWTVIGFVSVKFLALLILSAKISRKEISGLLSDQQEEKQKVVKKWKIVVSIYFGIVFLAIAYGMAIFGISWQSIYFIAITMLLGITGTFLFFQGISIWLEGRIKRTKPKHGLQIFTFRQVQENVLLQSKSLAISALLILAALCCLGYGISMAWSGGTLDKHVMDFTFTEDMETVEAVLAAPEFEGKIQEVFEVRLGMLWAEEEIWTEEGMEAIEREHEFNKDELMQAIGRLEASEERELLLRNLDYFTSPYLLPISDYNRILKVNGAEPIQMHENQMAFYAGLGNEDMYIKMREALKEQPNIRIDGKDYQLVQELCTNKFVVDRAITISSALVIPDELFEELLGNTDFLSYCNVVLNRELVEEIGVIQAIDEVNNSLKSTGLQYENYMQNIGRQLIYVVAASYTTIYLAIMFLIIANTVISVQFLMRQKKTGRRYQTLISLGSQYQDLQKSSHAQIRWYFGLPVIFAVFSSVFGVWSLIGAWMPRDIRVVVFFCVAMAGVVTLCVIEFIYITVVMKRNDKHILSLMQSERKE